VLGMVAEQPITIDDGAPIDTSFPGFVDLMNGLGGQMSLQNI
jgi:3-phosphoshikimate 1-carboxyvinyltransferase